MNVGIHAYGSRPCALQHRRCWRRSVRLRHARGGLRRRTPARAISFAGAAWPLCPRDRHCCGSGVIRRNANRLAPDRFPPADRAHRRVGLPVVFVGQGARRRRARGARPRPAEGARGERARADADLCVRAGGSDLDLAEWRGRVRARAPRRLGCRRCLRNVSQSGRARGQSDRYRGDRGPHHCLPGSRLGTDARPRAAGRHRRVFHHPDARRELSPVRRDRAVA
jgi:hypothetical protein